MGVIKQLYKVNLSQHWLSALINGDTTGLTDEEDLQLDDWMYKNPAEVYEPGREMGFCRDDITDLHAECFEVTLWGGDDD